MNELEQLYRRVAIAAGFTVRSVELTEPNKRTVYIIQTPFVFRKMADGAIVRGPLPLLNGKWTLDEIEGRAPIVSTPVRFYETIEAAWEGEIAPIADAIANNEILQQIDPLFQGYLNHLFDDDFGAIAGEPCLVQAWNLAHMGERNKAVCYAYLSFKYADCP